MTACWRITVRSQVVIYNSSSGLKYFAVQLSGKAFIFGRCRIQIWAMDFAVLTDILVVFLRPQKVLAPRFYI